MTTHAPPITGDEIERVAELAQTRLDVAGKEGWQNVAYDLNEYLNMPRLLRLCAAARRGVGVEAAHGVRFATVRDAGDGENWDIECRFTNGEKYAAIQVDKDKPGLADWIAAALSADQVKPVAQDSNSSEAKNLDGKEETK